MTVYLDVIWALNFLFDCLLLCLAAFILKRRVKIWRIAAGGFIGSLIILLYFTPAAIYSGHPLSKMGFSVLMVLASFGYKRLRFFLSALMALYFSTFLIGGALMGTHYFFQSGSGAVQAFLSSASEGFGDPVSWLFVFLGFPLAWHFSRSRLENHEMAKIKYEQTVFVEISVNNETFELKGLIDSGNQLYDPLSRHPVMFVSVKYLLQELPKELALIASFPDGIIQGEKSVPPKWESRLRIIPCAVVGQEHQLILAVKPEYVLIRQSEKNFRTSKVLVSFTAQELSSDGSYECIVHPKLLAGIPEGERVPAS
ncbi:sigma-E processing peptidase SpoIIGA [Neobacillus notoginsengisoli]|uniref:Sigma-E processing peptidase SpoIIGA n=1 Tax=Neobacillus notoginsengisoli TaxID=1578198 RepID=A0A417YQI9_9BACI|nr:sigma-E processing peptidase SpoIIGA [Neobacillus notoginsengisoli]RHW36490.1 sigma-E processing peptidase SpoIIGA [Neobacillus notoginsengisoli]